MDVQRSSHYTSLTPAPLTAQGHFLRAQLSPSRGGKPPGQTGRNTGTAKLYNTEGTRVKPAFAWLDLQALS